MTGKKARVWAVEFVPDALKELKKLDRTADEHPVMIVRYPPIADIRPMAAWRQSARLACCLSGEGRR